jgi:hypothetical protein
VAGRVQGGPDGGHLPVHHPRGGDHVGAGDRLGHRHPGVEVQGGVVVDRAVGGQDAAVAVVGVLVEAEVGHDHQVVAHLVADVGQPHLGDPGRVPGRRTDRVLGRGDAEEDDARDAQVGEGPHLLPERLPGVLHHARHGRDGPGGLDPLPQEEGGDEVVDRQPGLGHQPAQGRSAAQPAHAAGGVVLAHGSKGRSPTVTGL